MLCKMNTRPQTKPGRLWLNMIPAAGLCTADPKLAPQITWFIYKAVIRVTHWKWVNQSILWQLLLNCVQMQWVTLALKIHHNASNCFRVCLRSKIIYWRTCVPAVSAICPGKFRVKGGEEIQESPGQDDNVVDAGVQNNHLTAITYPWKTNKSFI